MNEEETKDRPAGTNRIAAVGRTVPIAIARRWLLDYAAPGAALAERPRQEQRGGGSRMSTWKRPRPPDGANAILIRMRRRLARVGALVAILTALLAAIVVFAVCACKSVR
jgi:hypothetical protein